MHVSTNSSKTCERMLDIGVHHIFFGKLVNYDVIYSPQHPCCFRKTAVLSRGQVGLSQVSRHYCF